jgi:hypothetical protein
VQNASYFYSHQLTKIGMCPETAAKLYNVRFHENPFDLSRVSTCGRTNRNGEANKRIFLIVDGLKTVTVMDI